MNSRITFRTYKHQYKWVQEKRANICENVFTSYLKIHKSQVI